MSIGGFEAQSTLSSPGLITIWSGALSDIPTGYVLCDGNNGTPDLRSQFVKSPTNSSDSPGSSVGQDSYTLSKGQMPQHRHSGTTNSSGGSHSHDVYENQNSEMDGYPDYGNGEQNSNTSPYGGSHAHNVTMNSTGGSSSVNNKPQFYEVAFIMKT